MAVVYSTSDVHPRDSVAYWVESVTPGFVRYTFAPSGGSAFCASLRAGALGSLSVSIYDCDPNLVDRTARDISRADSNDVFICLQVRGQSVHIQGDRHAVLNAGSFFLLDPRRPFAGRQVTRGTVVTLKVAREDIEARAGNVALLAGRALQGQGPLAGLAYGFLAMLPDCVDAIEEPASSKIADQALDLATLALAAEAGCAGTTLSSPRAIALLQLKAAIEARLHDPGLKPAAAAAAAGISVRYANDLLAQEDTCLERYIFSRRLERCRRALADPAQANRMIGEIAFGWGFSDLSHFSRRFKAEFGCSPGDYRRRAEQERALSNGDAAGELAAHPPKAGPPRDARARSRDGACDPPPSPFGRASSRPC